MRKIFGLILSFFILFLIPLKAFAQEQNIIVEKGKVINENPYVVAGQNIDILGVVNGDVIVGGGQINISGKINGDLIAGGGNIRISGEVTQNVRVAGGQVVVSGKVGKNLTVTSGNVEITETALIGGYLVSGAGNIIIYAPIKGNVIAGTANLALYNSIGGNLKVGSDQIYFSPDASVKGNFEYWSNKEPNIDSNAKIIGETTRHEMPQNWNYKTPNLNPTKLVKDFFGVAIGFKILSFFTLLLIGFLIIKLFPNFMDKTSDMISQKGWLSLLVGFLTTILFPIVFVTLLITIIGIPLAFILITIYGVYLYLAKIFIVYWLGKKLLTDKKSKYLSFAVAALLFSVVLIVPVFSRIIKTIVTFTGFGALLLSSKETFFKKKA